MNKLNKQSYNCFFKDNPFLLVNDEKEQKRKEELQLLLKQHIRDLEIENNLRIKIIYHKNDKNFLKVLKKMRRIVKIFFKKKSNEIDYNYTLNNNQDFSIYIYIIITLILCYHFMTWIRYKMIPYLQQYIRYGVLVVIYTVMLNIQHFDLGLDVLINIIIGVLICLYIEWKKQKEAKK